MSQQRIYDSFAFCFHLIGWVMTAGEEIPQKDSQSDLECKGKMIPKFRKKFELIKKKSGQLKTIG